MDIYAQLVQKIIKEQEKIIGPLAIEQARKVQGIKVGAKEEVSLEGNEKDVVDKLVNQYKEFFGQASVEVCKEAVKGLKKDLPADQLPKSLQ